MVDEECSLSMGHVDPSLYPFYSQALTVHTIEEQTMGVGVYILTQECVRIKGLGIGAILCPKRVYPGLGMCLYWTMMEPDTRMAALARPIRV